MTLSKVLSHRLTAAIAAGTMFFVLAASLIAVQPKQTEAVVPIMYPFGGKFIFVYWCNCSDVLLTIVGPPRPGIFLVSLTSTDIYLYAAFHIGAWSLGGASIPSACVTYVGTGCAPIAKGLTVDLVGTSI